MDWIPVPRPEKAFPSVLDKVTRIFAVGDLHGNFDGFTTILQQCDLIDENNDWIGGNSHLVQTGDVFGRGGQPGQILNLIKKLQDQAKSQGGQVHMVLGNHELFALQGCLQNNTRQEFEDFEHPESLAFFEDATWKGEEVDAKLKKRLLAMGCWPFFESTRPLGLVGRWLLQCPSVLKIGDNLFVHGGLSLERGLANPEVINQQIRDEILSPPDWVPEKSLLESNGPHWYRDFILRQDAIREIELVQVLAYQKCQRMVVGHTPTSRLGLENMGKITKVYGGRLICADTGIGHFHGGYLSAVHLENDKVLPVYPRS